MSKAAVIGVAIVGIGVIGGGGYYYASNKANEELHKTISLIEKSMPGSSLKYESSSVSPISQSATLNKVTFKDAKGHEYTADTLVLGGISKDKLGEVSLDKFHTMIDDGTIDIGHIDIKNAIAAKDAVIIEDGKIKKIFPSKVSFDLLNIQNVKAVGPKGRETITIAQYELKNYGQNRKSDQILKQFDFKSDYGNRGLKVNQMQLDGLDFAQIVAGIEAGVSPQTLFQTSLGQLKKGMLEGLDVKNNKRVVSLARLETDNSIDPNGDRKSTTVFSGLKIDTVHNAKLYPYKQLGYAQLDISGKISGNYNKTKQQWSFALIEIMIKDMGTLNANLQFNGPESLLNINDPARIMSVYKLVSLKVSLQNKGLLQKILDKTAKEKSLSVDKVKEDIISKFKQDAEKAITPFQKQGNEAVIALINDPKKSLVVEVKPNAPISILELVGQVSAVTTKQLNMSVKTEVEK